MEKVLILAPNFFGYEIAIKKEFQKANYTVDLVYFEAKSYYRILLHKLQTHGVHNSIFHSMHNNRVFRTIEEKYDFVLIIGARNLTASFLRKLQSRLTSNAKKVLYLWDSIQNLALDTKILDYFDKCYSFDSIDCEKYHMDFLPLFYIEDYELIKAQNDVEYDVGYVGTFRLERYELSRKIEQSGVTVFDYEYITKKDIKKDLWQKKYVNVDVNLLQTDSLSVKDTIDALNRCRCILDIPSSTQRGLSMRTFETLAMRKKIITTNAEITKYDFYNPNNVYVIDMNNVQCPSADWIRGNPVDIGPQILKNYALREWIKKLRA